MKPTPPSYVEMRALYALSARVLKMAPWNWMYETDVFVVKSPDTGELGFVSLMGSLGEHFAVAVYLGEEGFAQFMALDDGRPDWDPREILEVPQVQVSFEDKSYLPKNDLVRAKNSGILFRGRNGWPFFRRYGTGDMGRFISSDEAVFLAHVLEQVLEVAPRVRLDPDCLEPFDGERGGMLLRVPIKGEEGIVWEDSLFEVDLDASCETGDVEIDDMIEEVRALPKSDAEFQIDMVTAPFIIIEPPDERYVPSVVLAVESSTGLILSADIIPPPETREDTEFAVSYLVAKCMLENRIRPRRFKVRTAALVGALGTLATSLEIEIVKGRLPKLSRAKSALFETMLRSP